MSRQRQEVAENRVVHYSPVGERTVSQRSLVFKKALNIRVKFPSLLNTDVSVDNSVVGICSTLLIRHGVQVFSAQRFSEPQLLGRSSVNANSCACR
jgi:hypothetical protein